MSAVDSAGGWTNEVRYNALRCPCADGYRCPAMCGLKFIFTDSLNARPPNAWGNQMPQSIQSDLVHVAPALPGAAIVARIRRLIVVAVFAAVAYSAFMSASKGYCPGGVTADGSFTDAIGNVVDIAPTCINLTLRPSGLIYLAIVAIVIGALTMVLRRASDQASAMKYLDRAAAGIAILVVLSVIVSQVWFGLIPITDWDGAGTFFYPFPFGSVDLVTTPMNSP